MKFLSLVLLLLAGCSSAETFPPTRPAPPMPDRIHAPDGRWIEAKKPQAEAEPQRDEPSDEAYSIAALRELHAPSSSFASSSELDANQKWNDKKREWAMTLTDVRAKKAYLDWLDYEQRRIDDRRKVLKRDDVIRQLNIPKPPKD